MTFNFGPVDSLDAVPAEFKSVYNTTAGTDGKFTVADAHKPLVAAYTGVNTALTTERGKVTSLNAENAQRRQALAPWEAMVTDLGITPEDANDLPGAVKKHVTDLTSKVKGGESFKGDLAKIRDETEKRIKTVTDEKDKELAAMRTTLETHLVDKEALTALGAKKAKNGGTILLPHIKQAAKVIKDESGNYVVRAVDATGNVRFNSAAQPMSINDIVAEMAASNDYAFAFESTAPGGLGTQPGNGKQPVKTATQGDGKNEPSATQKIEAGLDQLTKKS